MVMSLISRGLRRRAAAIAAVGALLCAGAPAAWADDSGPVDATITVPKVAGLSDEFAMGVDVSTVLSQEESGVTYRGYDGHTADIFDVLAASGVNYVRIRIWNDPYDADGHGYGAGNVDVARALEIGERATAHHMKVLLDFHYSDFWADPGKQTAPKAWAGFTVPQKAAAVTSFTTDALQRFKAAGVDVGMVQVGNETNGGVAGVTGYTDMATIFSAGSAAVRAVLPDALVALHFTNPEKGYATVAAAMAGVDYDVFASSYYPYWHGTLANLTTQLSTIASTYGKKVMVAETSWAYTMEDGDGFTNSIASAASAPQYPISVQGQATEVHDVIQAVADVGDAGIGVFYWEPAWTPVGPPSALASNITTWQTYGSGWATSYAGGYDAGATGIEYGGSSWDNQAMFDFQGNPLASLKVFSYVRTGAQAPLAVSSVAPVTVTVAAGDAITLPATVAVTYNDGSVVDQPTTWNDAVDWITGPGIYTIPGTTTSGVATTATVVVNAKNYVTKNPSFEDASTSPWTVTGTGASIKATGDSYAGARSLAFYKATAYTFGVSQVVTGVPAGTYTLSATGQGGSLGATDSVTLQSTTSTGTTTAPFALTVWQAWSTPTLQVTVPADGTVTIGAAASVSAGAWGAIDDFRLVATAPVVDTSALQTLVDRAAGVTRARYTAESLATLDDAVVKAKVVLGATSADPTRLAQAQTLLGDALDALVVAYTPSITLGAASVHVGDAVAVTGAGFAPGEDVTVSLGSASSTVQASSAGAVAATLTAPAEAGTYSVTADGAVSAVTVSATVTVTVKPVVYAPHVADATVAYGTPVVVTGAGFAPGESVVVTVGQAKATVTATSAGAVRASVGKLAVGTYPVTARGAVSAVAATSTVKVVKATATVSLKASPASAGYGRKVTLTARVSPSGATGSVQLYDGAAKLGGAVAVSGGVATKVVSTLGVGTHRFKAVYLGSSSYTTATSATAKVVVARAKVTSVSISGKAFTRGTRPVVTVRVGKLDNGSRAAGIVTVRAGGVKVGTAKLSSSTSSVTIRLSKKYSTSVKVKATFTPTRSSTVAPRTSSTTTLRVR
ncbi:arabinogalactan endo-1,4-beta-galactosidase [Cellulomonas rhizosphaerae]|uniref:Arabinogalactan endo-beta-1,4-galactanase n=2 Tax=Cellulomonas rhizosphaerae TaxID=2293719 RepID=A0A413RKQ9_9CELL|nr:arabinogalactan endo-1,4-beta-galactosidase [Cellulomonas rhizosphaerae]